MPLRILFSIQGCGRGHITQAIALEQILSDAGHDVVGVLVGTETPGDVPSYLTNRIRAHVEPFRSPLFEMSKDGRSIAWGRTGLKSILALPAHAAGVRHVLKTVDRLKPDLVVSFYEPLSGLAMLRRPETPLVAVAHQFMFLHPRYPFVEGTFLERNMLKRYTQMTSLSAVRRLALSFYPAEPIDRHRIRVVPPLLREELFRLRPTAEEPFYLVYAWTAEFVPHILDWHDRNPDVRLECFIPKSGFDHARPHGDNLILQPLHDTLFLERMNACRGLVTTAGFESTAEALYLGKPLHMVPTHVEQQCNARDALLAGAGSWSESFDLDPLLKRATNGTRDNRPFRAWLSRAGEVFLSELELAAPEGARVHRRVYVPQARHKVRSAAERRDPVPT